MHFYVYYSYEEYGRGYIGQRQCKCLPEKDVNYFGSFHDKTFKPTQKIILEVFDNIEDSINAECYLHEFYKVDVNPHFANKSKQTSKKFYFCEKRSEETKRKISETKKNQPHKGGWPKGKKHSPEVIERCRLAALAQHRNKSK
jgi:hypothetical protein